MSTSTPAPCRGNLRALRAGLVGTWTVLLAMIGHRLGGGAWAPLVVLVPLVLTASAVAWWLAGHRLRAWGVALLIGLAQIAVHLLTCYLHGHLMVPSTVMLLGHLAAAAVTGVLLARADTVWWALLGPWVRVLRLVRLPVPWRAAWPSSAAVLEPAPLVLAHTLVRRGPPLA